MHVSYHNFPVGVGQKLEDPLEDFRWQRAVDAPCGHFGLTLLKFYLSGFKERCFPGELSFGLVCIRGGII